MNFRLNFMYLIKLSTADPADPAHSPPRRLCRWEPWGGPLICANEGLQFASGWYTQNCPRPIAPPSQRSEAPEGVYRGSATDPVSSTYEAMRPVWGSGVCGSACSPVSDSKTHYHSDWWTPSSASLITCSHENRGEHRVGHISTAWLLECIWTAFAYMIIPLSDVLLECIESAFANMIIPLPDV